MPAGEVPAYMLDASGHVRVQPYRTNLSQADAPKHVTYPYILKVIAFKGHYRRGVCLDELCLTLFGSVGFSSVESCWKPWVIAACHGFHVPSLANTSAFCRATVLVGPTSAAYGPCLNGTQRL